MSAGRELLSATTDAPNAGGARALSIVLPCWNEEEGIAASLRAAEDGAMEACRYGLVNSWQIVAVDDGSVDGTAALLAKAAESDGRVQVVTHASNRGLGAAVRSGLAAATGDVVLYTDADLPCDLVVDLPRALRLLRDQGADVVAAYRSSRTTEGPRRALYSSAYNALARTVFGLPLRDVNFAFKLMTRAVVDEIDLYSEGSFIDVELLCRARASGFRVIQFSTAYSPRRRGVSSLSSARTIAGIVREMVTVSRDVTIRGCRPGQGDRHVLIVNADDFGLTEGISDGIIRAHMEGIVTSTSVIALGRAFWSVTSRLGEFDRLGVGVHLALVGEDPPLLSAAEIPTLVDRRGRLAMSWRTFVPRAAAGRVDPADIRREFRAQLDAVQSFGLPVTHLDAHQHLQLLPVVGDVVIDLAVTRRIRCVRVPRSAAFLKGRAVDLLSERLSRRLRGAELVQAGWCAGLDGAGHMHGKRLKRILADLATRRCDVELGCHPGDSWDAAAYRWGYDWDVETSTLTGTRVRRWVDQAGLRLGTYGDLSSPRLSP